MSQVLPFCFLASPLVVCFTHRPFQKVPLTWGTLLEELHLLLSASWVLHTQLPVGAGVVVLKALVGVLRPRLLVSPLFCLRHAELDLRRERPKLRLELLQEPLGEDERLADEVWVLRGPKHTEDGALDVHTVLPGEEDVPDVLCVELELGHP